MNIFLREMKANLKSLLIWCGVMLLLIVISVAKFSAFANDPSMLAILDSMPKAMIDAMSLQAFNMTTLNGFYGLMSIFFGLMGGIAAAMWGSDSITKEERDRTVEFSLVLPVSRSKVITAKALAALVNCILFIGFTWTISIIAVQPYAPDSYFYSFLILVMSAMFINELIFLAIGILLGSAMKHYKQAGSTAVAIILLTYFLYVFSGMQARLEFLKYFTPFKYFDAAEFIHSGQLNGTYLLVSGGIIVISLAAAYYAYNKRDLYI